jgi:hypothetical protein
MAAFVFRLETADGVQADPPKLESAGFRTGARARRSRSVRGRCEPSTFATTSPTTHPSWSSRTWPDEPLDQAAYLPTYAAHRGMSRLRACRNGPRGTTEDEP